MQPAYVLKFPFSLSLFLANIVLLVCGVEDDSVIGMYVISWQIQMAVGMSERGYQLDSRVDSMKVYCTVIGFTKFRMI